MGSESTYDKEVSNFSKWNCTMEYNVCIIVLEISWYPKQNAFLANKKELQEGIELSFNKESCFFNKWEKCSSDIPHLNKEKQREDWKVLL